LNTHTTSKNHVKKKKEQKKKKPKEFFYKKNTDSAREEEERIILHHVAHSPHISFHTLKFRVKGPCHLKIPEGTRGLGMTCDLDLAPALAMGLSLSVEIAQGLDLAALWVHLLTPSAALEISPLP
jgi:hypothetical protein